MDKGRLLRHPLTLIAAIFVFLFVSSALGLKLPISVITQERGTPLVVEGQGKVTVVPDTAMVSFGIDESGASLESVQKSVNTKSKALVDALKKLGIDEKDIKTTSYNVFPEYDYGGVITLMPESRLPRIVGYRVSTTYEVKVKDFDKVNDVISVGTQSGANIVGGVSFALNDETRNKKLNEAREIAVKEAKEKAQGLAKAAGVSLGKVLNISEFPGFEPPTPIALKEGGDSQPPSPEIKPGETEISVTVSISFEIR